MRGKYYLDWQVSKSYLLNIALEEITFLIKVMAKNILVIRWLDDNFI